MYNPTHTDEILPIFTPNTTNDTHQYDRRTDLEVGPFIPNDTFEDLGMQKYPIEEGRKPFLGHHSGSDQTGRSMIRALDMITAG